MRTMEEAAQTLNAAIARIEYLTGCTDHLDDSQDIERRRRDLAAAEETRSTAALRILQLDAEGLAAKLLNLERQRSELLTLLHGFLAMEGPGSRDLRCTRTISAALLSQRLRSEQPAQDTTTAAVDWRARFNALCAGGHELIAEPAPVAPAPIGGM
jgi:hypothetical protein